MQTTKPLIATTIKTTDDELVIYVENRSVCIPWTECSPALAEASPEARKTAILSPGGYGIHWPALDEDLSVEGLVSVSRKK